jgi:hypothetical protein
LRILTALSAAPFDSGYSAELNRKVIPIYLAKLANSFESNAPP